jgi:hypothetical protein
MIIKTQEEYDKIMISAHNRVGGSIHLEATFNALRYVAKVQMGIMKNFYTEHVRPVTPLAFADFEDWLRIANPVLSALPPFLTDEDS